MNKETLDKIQSKIAGKFSTTFKTPIANNLEVIEELIIDDKINEVIDDVETYEVEETTSAE